MQLLHQPIALRLVDHESEIQIVGGLAHEVDLVILKELERRAELVQDAANIVAEQAQRGARSEDLHAAKLAERRGKPRERGRIEGVGGRDPARR